MKTILVVDDHCDTNQILCRLIQKLGYRTMSAYTGEGALATLAVERPDLLILDVMMPDMNGPEVLKVVRANPQTAMIPVVMYSAVADPAFQQHVIERGANEYWVKSGFDFSELKTRLGRYLDT
jgi:CheY-like chemotaxis protein